MLDMFCGPFVVQAVGINTVTLDIPGRANNVINVAAVKRYAESRRFPQEHVNVLPPPLSENATKQQVQAIMNQRKGGYRQTVLQYLVRFKGYGPEHDSWLAAEDLDSLYGTTYRKALTSFKKAPVQPPRRRKGKG